MGVLTFDLSTREGVASELLWVQGHLTYRESPGQSEQPSEASLNKAFKSRYLWIGRNTVVAELGRSSISDSNLVWSVL